MSNSSKLFYCDPPYAEMTVDEILDEILDRACIFVESLEEMAVAESITLYMSIDPDRRLVWGVVTDSLTDIKEFEKGHEKDTFIPIWKGGPSEHRDAKQIEKAIRTTIKAYLSGVVLPRDEAEVNCPISTAS